MTETRNPVTVTNYDTEDVISATLDFAYFAHLYPYKDESDIHRTRNRDDVWLIIANEASTANSTQTCDCREFANDEFEDIHGTWIRSGDERYVSEVASTPGQFYSYTLASYSLMTSLWMAFGDDGSDRVRVITSATSHLAKDEDIHGT
jgi:hypothetical protein